MSAVSHWSSTLPSSWRALPLKAVGSYIVSNVDKVPAEDELPVRLCNYTDVYKNDFITPEMEFMRTTATKREIAKFHLKTGDVVITKDSESWDDIAVPAFVTESADDLVCGYHLAILRGGEELRGRFLFRCLQAKAIRLQLELAANGITRFGFGSEAIGRLLLPVPSLPEQDRIAAFLDRETARVDGMIGKKQQLLGLLEEKRASLISHAITRSIEPNAKLRDSGSAWLRRIPAHWELKPLGFLLRRITYGFTNPMPTASTGPYLLTANDIGEDRIKFETARKTTDDAYRDLLTDKSRPRRGDILITKDGTLGRTALCDGTPCCINQSVAMLRVNQTAASTLFVLRALQAAPYQARIAYDAGGTTIKHIYITRLTKMPVALPPKDEQDEIVRFVEGRMSAFDVLLRQITESIALLREHRAALILAAVTGKIDVLNA